MVTAIVSVGPALVHRTRVSPTGEMPFPWTYTRSSPRTRSGSAGSRAGDFGHDCAEAEGRLGGLAYRSRSNGSSPSTATPRPAESQASARRSRHRSLLADDRSRAIPAIRMILEDKGERRCGAARHHRNPREAGWPCGSAPTRFGGWPEGGRGSMARDEYAEFAAWVFEMPRGSEGGVRILSIASGRVNKVPESTASSFTNPRFPQLEGFLVKRSPLPGTLDGGLNPAGNSRGGVGPSRRPGRLGEEFTNFQVSGKQQIHPLSQREIACACLVQERPPFVRRRLLECRNEKRFLVQLAGSHSPGGSGLEID